VDSATFLTRDLEETRGSRSPIDYTPVRRIITVTLALRNFPITASSFPAAGDAIASSSSILRGRMPRSGISLIRRRLCRLPSTANERRERERKREREREREGWDQRRSQEVARHGNSIYIYPSGKLHLRRQRAAWTQHTRAALTPGGIVTTASAGSASAVPERRFRTTSGRTCTGGVPSLSENGQKRHTPRRDRTG